jgi:iron(III) transport system ATP-binding protein
MLALEQVSHRYGPVQAVADLSLEVAREELVCLLGPSGCGKSTLLRIAAGLEQGGTGTVLIDGETVAGPGRWVPPERRRVGLVFQEPALFPHLSVADNVAFGLTLRGEAARRARVTEWLAQLGIAARAQAFPHMLSGGQQQRVALARALAAAPRIMLLDEPFSGLDARLREQIRDDTLHVLKKSGTATLLVTHDPEEAMFMADRIALMRDGHIEQCGTPTELYCRPSSPFVATFFSPTNRFTGRVEGGAIATPLGPVPAGDLAEGSEALVLTRQEAVRIVEGGRPTATGRVLLARLLGRQSLLHLRVADSDGVAHHVHARVAGVRLPGVGTELPLGLDTSQVFVFASMAA